MDPQIKSLLTTIGMTLSTSAAAWAVTHGYIHAADQSAVADAVVTAIGTIITGLLAWYKTRQSTPKALIDAVNKGDNGVKVVAMTEPAPMVSIPLKPLPEQPK